MARVDILCQISVQIYYMARLCRLQRIETSRYGNEIERLLNSFAANLALTIFLSSRTDGFQKRSKAFIAFGVLSKKTILVTIIPASGITGPGGEQL